MKKIEMGVLLFAVVFLGSCVFISATGNFLVTNTLDTSVTVVWTSQYGDSGSKEIPAGETLKVAAGRLLEADAVPPSQFFETFDIYTDADETTLLLGLGSIADANWAVEEDGYRSNAYTLTYPLP